jgi:hypothetical protein
VAEELEAGTMAAVEMTVVMEVTANPPLNGPDHTATHKIPVVPVHLALAMVIAVLRFPKYCPRILDNSITTNFVNITKCNIQHCCSSIPQTRISDQSPGSEGTYPLLLQDPGISAHTPAND